MRTHREMDVIDGILDMVAVIESVCDDVQDVVEQLPTDRLQSDADRQMEMMLMSGRYINASKAIVTMLRGVAEEAVRETATPWEQLPASLFDGARA